ncbi:phosphoenolpyruvate-protein phosphotransferase [Desulfovibrio sp. X2]|uniref:phosphoenolpyruvate--protein phosphotransferase n=1 Tax=Desulfovibrio sp. X2 TaxID=941449 RepID=UPI000358AEB2|nr:phosphoenolpyruvate--protein phosphotransferase [Desulfovibrio sp. X2]EPR41684.1 phosphoenolpyruvate-protein phosphotransferase [Desulfovibrio sp. X2]
MAKAVIKGIPVSAGIAIGKALFLNRNRFENVPRRALPPHVVPLERERLTQAFLDTAKDLEAAREKIPLELRDHAGIIDSHLMILKDPKLRGAAEKYLEEHAICAEWALEKAVADVRRAFSALDDPYIRERMNDVRMVGERVMVHLMGDEPDFGAIEDRVVLMAHDLAPADTVELEVDKIMSFATSLGAKTSHTGILARSLQIPAVVGVTDLEKSVTDGDLVIVDGLKGRIIIEPDDEELNRYETLGRQFQNYQKSIIRFCHLPGETRDGYSVSVLANIELFEEVAQVLDNGGEGVGLLRTEYRYMNRRELPTEDELCEEYSDLASILSPRTLTIRTLDIGADKMFTHFGHLEETNPAMGLRAIRFCMRYPEVFKTQIRAILRAAVWGNVRVMFPMISGLKELRFAKGLFLEAQAELRREGVDFNPEIPFGIMVEVPSAVMVSEFLAQEVDFFSIGTNDLIQYSMGIDRTNRYVSYLYQPLHPAIVRMIKHTVDAAHEAGIEVGLCGEMASDPFCVPILMGMGMDSLSMNPQAVPGIKRIIRQTDMDECTELLKLVLESRTVSRTNRLVRDIIFQRFPEELTFYTSLLDIEEAQ